MKTLVIDDDPFELMLLGHQLAHLGCTPVLQIKHAREAVELLKTEGGSVGLVFCDLRMPDIDGVQFFRHLAHLGWRGSLVLVSGEDERVVHTAERLALGYGVHLLGAAAKPVRLKQFQKSIDQHEARRATPCRAGQTTRLHEELRRAISAGELVIHYQPKVSFSTGVLVGAEALVRWQHPQAGSRIMKDVLTSLDILTRLRLKRIGLAIDDFGAEHSSKFISSAIHSN